MEIIIAVVAKIAESAICPVGQWLCYSCHYKSNMENLTNQETTLRDAKNRVQRAVKAASNNGEEIEDDVNTWLTKVDGILHQLTIEKLDGGEEEAKSRNFNASCLNLKQRHQLSRKAKKLVGNIAELLKNGRFVKVSYCPPSQNMVPEQNEDYMTLDSRKLVMKRIKEALGDANINKVGVSGLAGVGKSTLMEEICRQAKEEWLFNEVALAKVTDSPNTSRIQGEIANMLNLQFDSNETEIKRADRLQRRLQKDNKILVILDDIWKKLDLNAIGIPSKGCKLLLTSRDQRVLVSHMGTERNFELNILGEEEAWNLFEKMAGDSIKDDLDLQNEATKVAKECGGLPIALVTVSKALKDHKSLGIWKDALVQLRRPPPEHDTEIWSPVYSCIELSYRHLVSKEVQSLFLLCARQGYYISYRDLLRYGFGLCLFHGIVTLEEARNRLEKLVSNLQDSCLLIQSPHSSKEFYMHDVVRHVATMIASNDHNMFDMRGDGGQTTWPDVDALKRCEALCIHGGDHIHKYPNKIECPKLRYFHVQCIVSYLKTPSSTSFQGMDKLEDIFFQGMDKLEVLSLTNIQLSSLLPLTNLQTLCLDGCELGDIHWIGKLKTLVILSLARSDISNLPREIESLTRLQLLDLSHCYKLRVIPPNVLSSLVNLEELYMREINVQWEVEGPSNEGKNASLAELKKLSHLTTLEIDILNANNLPANLFSGKLERYKIRIGNEIFDPVFTWKAAFFMRKAAFSRVLKLNLNMGFQWDFGIKMLLKRTEYLSLWEADSTKSVLHELHGEDFQELKHLHIQKNGHIKHIPELRTPDVAFFPILETFILIGMSSLEEICQVKLPLSSFKNLKVLKVERCKELRFIFSTSIARGLSLLEELDITRCKNMGAIFVKEEEDEIEDQGDMMLFGRLQTLVLKDLPKLVGFLSTRETNSEGNLHDFQLPLLHHQVSFPSLQTLHMEGLPKIKHVWSCGQEPKTVIEHLQVLEISNCGVEEIVAFERGGEAIAIRTLMFPQVTKLKFRNLPSLKGFYKGVHVSKWPMLKEMEIERCEEFEIFASGVASFEETVGERQYEMSIKRPLFLVDEHSFPSLEKLLISNMDSLEIIFGKLEGQNGKEPQDLISPASGTEVSFPSLQTLHMNDLPKIKDIWSYDQEPQTMFRFPALQDIYVGKCESLTSLFPAWFLRCLEQLKKIVIKDCEVEEIVAVERGGEAVAIRTLVFPRVSTLELRNLKRLKWFCKGVHVSKWPMLKEMKIEACEEVEIFASGVVSFEETIKERQSEMSIKQPLFLVDEHSFPSLERLYFSNMDSLEIIFGKLEGQNGKEPQVLISPASGTEESGATTHFASTLSFPSLKKLHIQWMRKLEIIWQDQVTMTSFPNIQELMIFGCQKLLQSNLHTMTTLIQSLTRLEIKYCNSLRCGKLKNIVPSSVSLHNLTGLEISYCDGLINLLTSSTAKTLVQLERMTVRDCKRITEIVAMEDIGEANVVITFNKLRFLELRGLPNLTHFCSGPYSLGFPSLDEVIVRCCREMKTFSHGVLSTPKLKGVSDDYSWMSKRNLYWEDDLNTTTRCLWEESNQYDTRLLFRERVENSEEDEDHYENSEEGKNVAFPFRICGSNGDVSIF